MMIRIKRGGLAVAVALTVALALLLLGVQAGPRALAAESLNVNLAATTGPATGVGEGFLYGISQDGTQPPDQYLQPLGITAFRGGGHVTGGWIGDNYTYGSGTQTDVNTVITQARRITQSPYHAQYQVILSDIFGADGGQPSSTTYPCTNGNCSNWVTFIADVVGALQASGLKFSYDIWNEPDISIFWPPGMATTQYFQMWDSAYNEIRSIAPGATIVGPDLAFTPQQSSGEWQSFFSHVKGAGTVPDEITNHDEGDGDDPVTVAQSIDSDLSAAGISSRLLSANEYQPADRQTAGVTAWYLARFAQSGYANAMRGNWVCCLTPNLTGILTQSGSSYVPNGNWWVMRSYADMTGSLVSTSGQVGSTAISASEDSSAKRAVAIIGDDNGYTGDAPVTFSGFSSVPWLSGSGTVNVVVDRIPDQYPLSAPQVVYNQSVSTSGGSITVPVTFQASHDAFAIYLTPSGSGGTSPTGPITAGDDGAKCVDDNALSTANGNKIQMWDCNGGANQQWTVEPDGTLQVLGKCMDITAANYGNGTGIELWDCNGGANQQWQAQNGTLVNPASGKCLDDPNFNTANGTQLDLWACNGGSNQQWGVP